MALTKGDVYLWEQLASMKAITASPSLLEIGEANWWGDVPLAEGQPSEPFAAARWFYDRTLGEGRRVAIDLHGDPAGKAYKLDLNEYVAMPVEDDGERGQFDVVVNSGTAEHVFNQHQLFKTIHDWCNAGGLMVHAAPMAGRGWLDHGFYSYNPCFFADLASANGYDRLLSFWWATDGTISHGPEWPPPGADAMIYVALRKTADAPFRIPRQGRYS